LVHTVLLIILVLIDSLLVRHDASPFAFYFFKLLLDIDFCLLRPFVLQFLSLLLLQQFGFELSNSFVSLNKQIRHGSFVHQVGLPAFFFVAILEIAAW
jgi:hypothetical protein